MFGCRGLPTMQLQMLRPLIICSNSSLTLSGVLRRFPRLHALVQFSHISPDALHRAKKCLASLPSLSCPTAPLDAPCRSVVLSVQKSPLAWLAAGTHSSIYAMWRKLLLCPGYQFCPRHPRKPRGRGSRPSPRGDKFIPPRCSCRGLQSGSRGRPLYRVNSLSRTFSKHVRAKPFGG